MSLDLLKHVAVPVFPAADVEERLRSLMAEAVEDDAKFSGEVIPTSLPELYKWPVQLDSLTVVGMLCELDGVLGFQLKDNTVRSGGYHSINDAIDHLLPKIEKLWARNKGLSK